MKNKVFGQYYTWASIFAFFGSLRGMCPLKTKNCVLWADENPHDVAAMPLHEALNDCMMWHRQHICSWSVLLRICHYRGWKKSCCFTNDRYKLLLQNYVTAEVQSSPDYRISIRSTCFLSKILKGLRKQAKQGSPNYIFNKFLLWC